MTYYEFFGCTFIAFGPPFAMFLFTVAKDPVRIIILISGAFFWLLSLLLSSILWYAVVPLRTKLAFGLVFSVIFQELFRLAFYKLLRKAESGLKKITEAGNSSQVTMVSNSRNVLAYVSGLGFGLMSGAFSLVNVLADAIGPGTVGLNGSSDLFIITSAFFTLCFILLHTFWGIIFFNAMDNSNYLKIGLVCGSHMLISCLTLLNSQRLYLATLIPAYIVLLICAAVAFVSVGGSMNSIKAFLKRSSTSTVSER